MNANIKKVDELMKNRNIKFSVACKAYKLIRRGMSLETALIIANAREGRSLEKTMKKNKSEKTLDQLVEQMNKAAEKAQQNWAYGLGFKCDEWENPTDALNYVSAEASRKLNAPRIGKDALDLCYSNTNGAEVLF